MSADRIFDGWADDFERTIYDSSKGYIRLNVLWHDLLEALPRLQQGHWRILDAGGGTGQIASKLAHLGHTIVVCDPSTDMLAKAERTLRAQGVQDRVQLIESSIQQLPERVSGQFNLVLCHAVLEWLASPKEALLGLRPFVQPDGYLSLMYYNKNAALLTALLAGEFASAWTYLDGGTVPSGYQQQSHPLDPLMVRQWIQEAGFDVMHSAGIRMFHDHLPEQYTSGHDLAQLLLLEKQLRTQEPFSSLGQHIHVLCQLHH